MVILNKVDLVDTGQLNAVREQVRGYVPTAKLVESALGQVSTEILLGVGASRLTEQPELDSPGHHVHAEFDTWTYSVKGPIDRPRLIAIIEQLPATIIRAKGILHLADDLEHRVIFQLVGRRWEFERGDLWGEEAPESRLVLIGSKGSFEKRQFDLQFAQL